MDDETIKVRKHYQRQLSFRSTNICLPNNRKLAQKRLSDLKRRMFKDKSFQDHYLKFMEVLRQKNNTREPTEI